MSSPHPDREQLFVLDPPAAERIWRALNPGCEVPPAEGGSPELVGLWPLAHACLAPQGDPCDPHVLMLCFSDGPLGRLDAQGMRLFARLGLTDAAPTLRGLSRGAFVSLRTLLGRCVGLPGWWGCLVPDDMRGPVGSTAESDGDAASGEAGRPGREDGVPASGGTPAPSTPSSDVISRAVHERNMGNLSSLLDKERRERARAEARARELEEEAARLRVELQEARAARATGAAAALPGGTPVAPAPADVPPLEAEVAQLRASNAALVHQLEEASRTAESHRAALDSATDEATSLLALDHIPTSLPEVLEVVARAWGERLIVTREAWVGARAFTNGDLDEEWQILRSVPTVLWELYFGSDAGCDVEVEYQKRAGFAFATVERELTMKNRRLMKLRDCRSDTRLYHAVPHIKGRSSDPTRAFRVHIAVDRSARAIVIGHVGAHLETIGTSKL